MDNETELELTAAGWKQTRASGNWYHPAFPAADGRRRLFPKAAALALLHVDPTRITLVPTPHGIEDDPED